MIAWIEIASVWMVALFGGWLLRIFLPSNWFIFTARAGAGYVYPVNRIAFWACLIVATLITAPWAARLCIHDLRVR